MAPEHHSGGDELGRFLRARRTQTSPQSAGLTPGPGVRLTPGPGVRRTPGLRREELATLAGVSIDYYTRMERGKETRPSPAVINALARALQLDDASTSTCATSPSAPPATRPGPPRRRAGPCAHT